MNKMERFLKAEKKCAKLTGTLVAGQPPPPVHKAQSCEGTARPPHSARNGPLPLGSCETPTQLLWRLPGWNSRNRLGTEGSSTDI